MAKVRSDLLASTKDVAAAASEGAFVAWFAGLAKRYSDSYLIAAIGTAYFIIK